MFDVKAQSAKCRNYKFEAKSIRNDMTLHKSNTFETTPDAAVKKIVKVLNLAEVKWTKGQKKLKEEKILEKVKKGKDQAAYTNKLLQV